MIKKKPNSSETVRKPYNEFEKTHLVRQDTHIFLTTWTVIMRADQSSKTNYVDKHEINPSSLQLWFQTFLISFHRNWVIKRQEVYFRLQNKNWDHI